MPAAVDAKVNVSLGTDWGPSGSANLLAELKIADHVYIIGDGVLAGEGTAEEIRVSEDPFVHQFIHAEPDGPIKFHYPSRPIGVDLDLNWAG